jgi:hypothetical protein
VLAAAVATFAFAASASAASVTFFQTPSGNIGCAMSHGFVRCDTIEHSWTVPPKPATCEFDWAGSIGLGGEGPAKFLCVSDAAFDPNSEVVGYGERISKHRFRCASKTKGLRCVNRKSGHGFFVSRDEVRLF